MTPIKLNADWLLPIIQSALAEDIGSGDKTTLALIPPHHQTTAYLVAKQDFVLAGLEVAKRTFLEVNKNLVWHSDFLDGATISNGEVLASIEGEAGSILTAERVALNFLQLLSGIATQTREYVAKIAHTKVKLLDTRKTIPNLRLLSKYAASIGGAQNHRLRLDDAILIKDNHIALVGSMKEAIHRAKLHADGLPIIIECDTLEQVEQALQPNISRLLLDNMTPDQLRIAVKLVHGRIPLEASGGITLENIASIAETGVDYISVGKLTHSARAVDISLDIG